MLPWVPTRKSHTSALPDQMVFAHFLYSAMGSFDSSARSFIASTLRKNMGLDQNPLKGHKRWNTSCSFDLCRSG